MCSVNHNLKTIFIHVPKTGGSYIENILKSNYGFIFDYEIKSNNYGFIENSKTDNDEVFPILPKINRGCLKYYMNSEYIKEKYNITNEMWNSYFKFAFVRNPYSRLISGYEFIKNDYYNNYYYNTDKTLTFPSLYELFSIQKKGFDSPIYKKNKNLYYYHYYHLFITQYDHLINNLDIYNIIRIAKFENLDEELIFILKDIGIDNYTCHLNYKTEIINKTNMFQNINDYFDEELLTFVNDYYDNDFKFFGYKKCFNIIDLSKAFSFEDKNEIIKKQHLLKFIFDRINTKIICNNNYEQKPIYKYKLFIQGNEI
jgi:hypothetical protein